MILTKCLCKIINPFSILLHSYYCTLRANLSARPTTSEDCINKTVPFRIYFNSQFAASAKLIFDYVLWLYSFNKEHETIQDNGNHGELRSDERLGSTKSYLQQKRIDTEQMTQMEGFVNQDSVRKDISDVSVSIF